MHLTQASLDATRKDAHSNAYQEKRSKTTSTQHMTPTPTPTEAGKLERMSLTDTQGAAKMQKAEEDAPHHHLMMTHQAHQAHHAQEAPMRITVTARKKGDTDYRPIVTRTGLLAP